MKWNYKMMDDDDSTKTTTNQNQTNTNYSKLKEMKFQSTRTIIYLLFIKDGDVKWFENAAAPPTQPPINTFPVQPLYSS